MKGEVGVGAASPTVGQAMLWFVRCEDNDAGVAELAELMSPVSRVYILALKVE